MRISILILLTGAALPICLGSCASTYYATMEQFGVHKRDILVDRVKDGREDQADAKEQFQTTMEVFQELTNFDGGDLEKLYKKLNKEYERCEESSEDVSDRIEKIDEVANDLFEEWQTELDGISDANLRGQSATMLADTQSQYRGLITTMRTAESKMAPVLQAFSDHVTFLKHNLNAQAIASLQDTFIKIESDIGSLLADMQKSIDEADAFIASMGSSS